MKKISIIKFSNKKIGFLYKNTLYDINSFDELDTESYSTLKSGKLCNLPLQPFDKDFISELKSTFPYTKIGRTYAFHINWIQKFFIRINEDNTMNIYSGYPVWILKRLLSFIKYAPKYKYKINDKVDFIIHLLLRDDLYTGTIIGYNHEGNYIIKPDDYDDDILHEEEIVTEEDIYYKY